MRIGIDCRTILSENARYKAGVAHYTYYLVKYLLKTDRENEYVLFFEGNPPREISEEAAKRGRVEVLKWRFSSYKRFLPYIYSHLLLSSRIKKAHLRVFHSPANVVPLGLLRSRNRPKIAVTVHDLAIYRHPEWFPEGQGFAVKHLVPQTIKAVEGIIAPSRSTARDIQELFAVGENRITVIPHGVEERFFQATPLIRPPGRPGHSYVLFVGTLEPRKNLVRLIRAYASLPGEITTRFDLVLAGEKGWKYQDIFKTLESLPSGVREGVRILGHYPGEELPGLFQGAAVFVYPSLYEGFGLPVLEALAGGCLVVASRAGSLPEIAPKEAVTLVDPGDERGLASAILQVIRDGAFLAKSRSVGPQFARQFTWERTAAETLRVYQEISHK